MRLAPHEHGSRTRLSSGVRPLLLVAALLTSSSPSAAGDAGAGRTHPGDLVTFGRPAAVEGRVEGTVVAVGESAWIGGEVLRDVVVLGGSAVIAPGAHVAGDVLVLGGSLDVARGARVDGRRLTLAAAEAAFLSELETSPLAPGSRSSVLLGFRLLLLLAWLVVGLLLLRLLPRRVVTAAGLVPGGGARAAVIGLTAVLAGLLLSAFALLSLPSALGLGLAGTLVSLLAFAKAFGMAAVFVAVGRLLTRGAARGSALFGDPAALSLGVVLLGVASLVPLAGPLVWAAASVLGIGLALVSLWPGASPAAA